MQLIRNSIERLNYIAKKKLSLSLTSAKPSNSFQLIFAAMKFLMVCLGNICRSPLAEGILNSKIQKAGLNWIAESAGTAGYHIGQPPHKLSQKVAALNGVDICRQKCRQFTKDDLLHYDRIYVMDAQNYNDVKRMSGNNWDESKVEFLLNELHAGENRGVPDPWYGEEPGYHEVYDLIDKACDAIIIKYSKTGA